MKPLFSMIPMMLVLAGLLASGGSILAQALPTPPDPAAEGKILLDDVWVPSSVVYGDGAYSGTAWPGGVVRYAFDGGFPTALQAPILDAMAEIEAVSQVRFLPWVSGAQVLIVRVNPLSTNVSNSELGMQPIAQFLNIASSHFDDRFVIVHELFHALGFVHEHQRLDRNTYVSINLNLVSQTACDGNPCDGNFIQSFAVPTGAYDFESVMHYRGTAFSINGNPTITCRPGYTQFQSVMGQRSYVSPLDAQGMATRYGGPSSPSISNLSPSSRVAAATGFNLELSGARFHRGSLTSDGIQGSRVRWDGTILATEYVDKNTLRAFVPPSLAQAVGSHTVWVENDSLAGGGSAFAFFSVSAPPCAGTNDREGHGLAVLRDVNGDGADDYVVGIPGAAGGNGRAECRSGRTGQVLWALNGGTNYQLGFAVGNGGDINGDGFDDVLISAPQYSSWRGLVRLVNGQTGALIRTILGPVGVNEFGWSVSTAGDLDLDGVPDVAVGAPAWNNTGMVQLHSGANGAVFFTLSDGQNGCRFGFSVSGGWDATGDGRPEVVVGAPWWDGTVGQDQGKAFVYQGAFGTLSFSRQGDGRWDYFGRSVALVRSTRGESVADVAVGASDFGSIFGAEGGTGYVRLFGRTLNQGIPVTSTLATWYGTALGDRYGQAVGEAGDLDQDGYMDILIGAIQDGIGTGAAVGPGYVEIRSGRTGDVMRRQSGTSNGDQFGWTVAGGGDLEGYGQIACIVGTPFGDIPCPSAGQVDIVRLPVAPALHKPMITEVYVASGSGVEIANFSSLPSVLTGWKVRVSSSSTTVESTPFPNLTLQPGQIMIVRESGVSFSETPAGTVSLATLPSLPTTGNSSVALVTRGGIIIDEVRIASVITGVFTGRVGGGLFRGYAAFAGSYFPLLPAPTNAVERYWGLDSNSGGDWTSHGSRSMGLENASNGVRGLDPLPVAGIVLNEVDDNPDFIELYHRGGMGALFGTNLNGWSLLISPDQNNPLEVFLPFETGTVLGPGGFLILGESPNPPSEKPAGVPYIEVSGNLPMTAQEYTIGLRDSRGRIVDVMRVTGDDDGVVHNHPRVPGPWSDFLGSVQRIPGRLVGRNPAGVDRDHGLDFRNYVVRTMGLSNGTTGAWVPPFGDGLDVRLNDAGGGGITVIINAGPEHAGEKWSFAFSYGHLQGTGPFVGLGGDAYNNWLLFSNTPPWNGILDARGTGRYDVPPGTLPAGTLSTDDIFLTQDVATGQIIVWTAILEFDL